jgi:hypothetical protein
MAVSNNYLDDSNYTDMPYLLEVNFFGEDDNGKPHKLSDHTKYFPIKILSIKIKASVKGSEYQISAVPFGHSANMETVQSIKTRMEITGKTIGEYFSNTNNTATQNAAATAFEQDKQRNAQISFNRTVYTHAQALAGRASAVLNSSANQNDKNVAAAALRGANLIANGTASDNPSPVILSATSFVAAYNDWYQQEYKNGNIGYADQIQFVFLDKNISESSIVDVKKNSIRNVAAMDSKTAAKAANGANAESANFNSVIHDLEPGSTVNDVINVVLPQSDYFLSQVKDSSLTGSIAKAKQDDTDVKDTAQAIKMWKVVPSIELHDFDKKRNEWGKLMTFYIDSYDAYQTRDDRLPKSPPPNPVKRYDYFYTGKNNSVINFDIEFNFLYYTAINVDRGKNSKSAGATQVDEDQKLKDTVSNATSKTNIQPDRFSSIANSQDTGQGGAINRSETINALSALRSLYTTAGGDMLNVRLQIIGDPEFIKQDDVFISPGAILNSGAPKDPGNQYLPGTQSLKMDESEIYCYLTFKTPTDFNDDTGMYDMNSTKNKYHVSEFSGYYRVITVTSEFRGGKFTQTLDLIRQPNQPSVNTSEAASGKTQASGDADRTKQTATDDKKAKQSSDPSVTAKDLGDSTQVIQPPTVLVTNSSKTGDTNLPTTNEFSNQLKTSGAPDFAPPTSLMAAVNNNTPPVDISEFNAPLNLASTGFNPPPALSGALSNE